MKPERIQQNKQFLILDEDGLNGFEADGVWDIVKWAINTDVNRVLDMIQEQLAQDHEAYFAARMSNGVRA